VMTWEPLACILELLGMTDQRYGHNGQMTRSGDGRLIECD
jgi:hypothetical protein